MKKKASLLLIVTVAAVTCAPEVVITENPTPQSTNGGIWNDSQLEENATHYNTVQKSTQNERNFNLLEDITNLSQHKGGDEDDSIAYSGSGINPDESGTHSSEEFPTTDKLVETTSGPVYGFPWQESNEIIAYLDIPYGKFLSDFENPSEASFSEEPLKTTEHTKRCPQLDNDGSYVGETDCLTLSIFVPAKASSSSVLFYIHESEFTRGSGDPTIYGPEYLVPKNVILVLPNYRLGPLGFLCLGNDTIPGNAGLKDLAMALKWTANNIKAFGGDPSSITVGGDGTSAALAGYLALSPMSKQYVTKVITDSGSVLSHWAIDRNPVYTAKKVYESVLKNINLETEGDLVFHNVNRQILLKSAKDITIRPCIEPEGFLTDTPWNILQEEKFNNITFMIGSANHAGLIEALHHNEASITQVAENFATMIPDDLVFDNDEDRKYIGERLKRHYFIDGNITMEHTEELSLYHTDASYLGPTVRAAHALAAADATVFLYEFSFVGSLNRELQSIVGAPRHGAIRGDIAGYLFTLDSKLPETNTPEERMVQEVADLWVNFIQNSEPTHGDIDWQPVEGTTEHWLEISESTRPHTGIHVGRLELWTDLYRDHFVDSRTSSALGISPCSIFVTAAFALINFF